MGSQDINPSHINSSAARYSPDGYSSPVIDQPQVIPPFGFGRQVVISAGCGYDQDQFADN